MYNPFDDKTDYNELFRLSDSRLSEQIRKRLRQRVSLCECTPESHKD